MDCTVKDIIRIMESIAPPGLAESWDNVGLLIGSRDALVKRIMVTLDVTSKVIDEAVEGSVDLIISHHPVIFKSIKSVTDDGHGKLLLRLIESGIAVYCAHTNFDKAAGGTDDALASVLGLADAKLLKAEPPYYNNGFGRIGELNQEMTLTDYIEILFEKLQTEIIDIIGDSDKSIKKIASCAGAGGDFMMDAKSAGADVFITGELKYHEAVLALDMGMTVVALGHHTSEYPGIRALKSSLQNAIDGLQYNMGVVLSNSGLNVYNRKLRKG